MFIYGSYQLVIFFWLLLLLAGEGKFSTVAATFIDLLCLIKFCV